MGEERRAVRWRVRGRVQGVGFRWYTRGVAQAFGGGRIAGRVRNLPDGSVEIEAAGTGEDLALFEEEVRRGPRGARVDALEEESITPVPAWDRFEIDR